MSDVPTVKQLQEAEVIPRVLHFTMNLTAEAPKVKAIYTYPSGVTVVWGDGTQNKATCDANDKYDVLVGFAMCLAKKMYGKSELEKIIARRTKVAPARKPKKATGGDWPK